MKKILFPLLFLFLISGFIFPQESPVADSPADSSEEPADSPEEIAEQNSAEEDSPEDTLAQDILEMDIRTSSLMELASWCRSIGLSEGGTRDDLANRLRRHYGLPFPGGSAASEGRVIVIESARTTEYFTLDVVDEEYARLRGNVIISLKDGNSIHRVKAWEIIYNRTRNVITASGGVEYIKETDDSIETFRGESITVNLDNWSSIFLDGFSERSVSGGETAYRFSGTVISRSSEEATVLTRAEITNGQNPDALWSLNASKLWLLPDSDWAVFNAVLKVGNIPVLWLPFFFYPSDEIVFHPVIGYRTREGTFVQTTTYILGRPKSSGFTENSITRIFGASNEGEKVREGLFLRSSGQRTRPADEVNLSVLFDAYANMGAYLGAELTVPGKGVMGVLDFSFGLGLTRNIFVVNYGGSINSTPYRNQDGVSEWNSSYLFSLEFPLRYRLETSGSLFLQDTLLSWSFPFYSDPYVNRDFLNRTEELDWLGMLREGANTASQTTTDTSISSYSWNLNGSYNPQITVLYPYLSSFSVSSISGSMGFLRLAANPYDAGRVLQDNPDKNFFVPDRLNISLSVSAAGTPFTFGASSGASSTSPANGQKVPDLLPALPRRPWEDVSPGESGANADPHSLQPPVLGYHFSSSQNSGSRLSFDYRIAPTGGFEQQFRLNPAWGNAGDIEVEASSRLIRAGARASLGFSVSQPDGGFYSASFRLNGSGNWQDYTYLNEKDFQTPGTIAAARSRVHNQTSFNSTYDFSVSYTPFFRDPVWSGSGINYSLSGLIGNYLYDTERSIVTDTEDDPRWKWVNGKWNEKDIGSHQAGINVAANVMNYTQNLSITSTLWPKQAVLSGNAVARAWISETRIQGSIFEPYNDKKRELRPVDFTETLRFGDAGSFQFALRYESEAVRETIPVPVKEAAVTSIRTSLNLYGFTASYSAAYMVPYLLDQNDGWLPDGTSKKFESQSLGFSYSKSQNANNLWNNRLSMNFRLDAGINFDLQRYTYSSLNFGLVVSMRINNFLDLGLSYTMVNSQIYQYFQMLPFFTADVELPPGLETNFFVDLMNSFRFDSEELRRSSGFKVKGLTLDLVHHLGDWNANLRINLAPYRDDTGIHPVWKHNYQISFMVQWIPIGEIKTEFVYDEQKFTFR